jgi:dihydrofolate reductase
MSIRPEPFRVVDMRRIAVVNNVTLDGVMQAPARPDEDVRGGFAHGGWAVPYNDDVMAAEMGKRMARGAGGALLLGRRTYEDFARVWPQRTDNPYTEVLNRSQKYVVSTTLREPLPWVNSTLLGGIDRLPDGNLTVLGSGELTAALLRAGLVDELLLLIHPLILGTGRRLFPDGASAELRLVEAVPTTTGVMIATYQRA